MGASIQTALCNHIASAIFICKVRRLPLTLGNSVATHRESCYKVVGAPSAREDMTVVVPYCT